MFDDNHRNETDLMFRSILENGREDVPPHLWEGVSRGLDKAAARRSRILWLRRSVIGAAAAAAVAAGIILNHEGDIDMAVPAASGDMIAVVEKTEASTPAEEGAFQQQTLLAHASQSQASIKSSASRIEASSVPHGPSAGIEDSGIIPQTETTAGITDEKDHNASTVIPQEVRASELSSATDIHTENADWEEDEKEIRSGKIRTSLVISGIAGTNNPQNNNGIRPLKSPGMLKAPSKTTVEQVGDQISYGIPVSFGAGVKLHFTRRWSLGVGINYTLLTSRFNAKYTKVEDGTQSVPITQFARNTQHYIGIPINAYYNIISQDFINFYAYGGGAVEKCAGNHYRIQTTPAISHKEQVKGVQLSVNAGIGVEFMLGRYTGLYLDPSLRYYFRGGQPKSIRTAQPLMLGFEMGLRFRL